MNKTVSLYLDKIRRRMIRLSYGRSRPDRQRKKLALLIGPESTGTRVFTSCLSLHPQVLGTPAAAGHLDVLDDVWLQLDERNERLAAQCFPDIENYQCVLTRRSMPHARVFGKPAIYMDFPRLEAMDRLCRKLDLEMILLITARSYIPNILSWTQNRLSAQRSSDKARLQYQASYRYLFGFINKTGAPFYMLSLEGLILDGEAYVQGLFQMLDLPPHPVELDLKPDVNSKYYRINAQDQPAERQPAAG